MLKCWMKGNALEQLPALYHLVDNGAICILIVLIIVVSSNTEDNKPHIIKHLQPFAVLMQTSVVYPDQLVPESKWKS